MSIYGTDYPEPPDLDPWATEDDPSGDLDDGPGVGSTWAPLDLAETVAGVLAGTISRPAPTVGHLDDGRALFYPGRVNGIAGQSGAGKSWTALAVCAQELEDGRTVAYVDLEDDAAGTVSRLLALGVDSSAVIERFAYVQPGEKYGPAARCALVAALDALGPSVVVVDSTGEAMALDGARPNDDDDTARWFRHLPTAVARRTGAAVVVLDHVVKADEGGLWPIGSQRKRAAITGAQYMQSTVKAFSQDTAGLAKLVCAKDRHGNYRTGQRVADVHVTPGAVPLVDLRAPGESTDAGRGDWRPTALMERISTALEAAAEPLSFRAIDDRVRGKADHKRTALRCLVDAGHVAVSEGARNAKLHTLVKAYAQREDPRSDLYRGPEPGTHSEPDECVSVSVSYRGDTGHTHSTVSGTHSGHGGDTLTDDNPVSTLSTVSTPGADLGGQPVIHKGDDPDDRPRCEDCTRRLGASEQSARVCLACHRVRIATEAARGSA